MKSLVDFINESKEVNEKEYDGYEIYLDGNDIVADDKTVGSLLDDATVEIDKKAMKKMHWDDDDVIKMLATVAESATYSNNDASYSIGSDIGPA